ncbi:MAG: hypothetical protein IT360_15000 [Gemmatimonadaceae bacterium]|nr:hypothetical protein [Gemmatimonadaceae bacterium]
MMEWLGRGGNVVPVATGKHISLRNAAGVTFVCYEDGGAQAIAIKESVGGAGEQALGCIDYIYAGDGVGSVLTRETTDANGALSASSSMVKKDTTAFDMAVIYVPAEALSEGFDSVECTIDGAGICVAIVHDLYTQRAPQNLPAAAV